MKFQVVEQSTPRYCGKTFILKTNVCQNIKWGVTYTPNIVRMGWLDVNNSFQGYGRSITPYVKSTGIWKNYILEGFGSREWFDNNNQQKPIM